jgi:DNA adenine methylase
MKSPLKWAGGKRKLVSDIQKLIPKVPHSRLIEPFVGGGSVFLNAQFDEYLLVDSNPDLIDLFNQIKHQPQAFVNESLPLFVAQNNDADVYYKLRDEFNQTKASLRRAALFLYLNRHGYNGLCRYNAKGGYNVPFGRYKKPYFPANELVHLSKRAQHAVFETGDFETAFLQAKAGDIVYCDPPYSPINETSSFTAYSGFSFNEDDHQRLVNNATQAQDKGITTIISNHLLPFTTALYADADKLKKLKVARNISCKGKVRKPIDEVLALYLAK